MRTIHSLILFLFALVASIHAQEDSQSYDATVYVTSTVYRVSSVTMSGTPTGAVQNSTSTIPPVLPTSHYGHNETSAAPTDAPAPSTPPFEGAAAVVNVNAFVAVAALAVGYLVV